MQIKELIGNQQLLGRDLTLFLCSKHAPLNLYHHIFQWAENLTEKDCIACFNSTVLESEVLKTLLINNIPTILYVVNRFTDCNNLQIQKALKENRLLIIVLRRDESKGLGATPTLRNKYALSNSTHVVCGYINNQKGSIYPLIKERKDIQYLANDTIILPEEHDNVSKRWTVAEDKTLLRMYYADMGIHAIHKVLQRSYQSIDIRIRSITLPDEVLKGRLFEDYVLEQFDRQGGGDLALLEWRSDKSWEGISPVSNQYPDFVFQFKKKTFAVECKWRERLINLGKDTFNAIQINNYQQYSLSHNIPVTVVLGVGGEPSWPEVLYSVPLKQIDAILSGNLAITATRISSLDLSSFL